MPSVFCQRMFLLMIIFALPSFLIYAQSDEDTADYYHIQNSNVYTGDCYNVMTRSVVRSVVDMTIPNAPFNSMVWSRIFNSSRRQWVHSYQWKITYKYSNQTNYINISYPSGAILMFTKMADSTYRADGCEDRLFVNQLGDGSAEFNLKFSNGNHLIAKTRVVVDLPNEIFPVVYKYVGGFEIYFSFDFFVIGNERVCKLAKVSAISGQYFKLTYGSDFWSILSSNGDNVIYTVENMRAHPNLFSFVQYADGTVASYTYQAMADRLPDWKVWPLIFRDLRQTGRMRDIQYKFQKEHPPSNREDADPRIPPLLLQEIDPYTGKMISGKPTGGISPDTTEGIDNTGLGFSRVFKYDYPIMGRRGSANAHLVSYTDFLGNETSLDYDARPYPWNTIGYTQRIKTIKNADGSVCLYKNEPVLGKILEITYPDNSKINFKYTDSANPYFLESRTDENGNVTSFSYYTSGLVQKIEYPDGGSESWSYNNIGQIVVHTLKTGAIERFAYDERARLIRHWPPSEYYDSYVGYTYYPDGHAWADHIEAITDQMGRRTVYEYDIQPFAYCGTNEAGFYDIPKERIPCHGRGQITKIINNDGSKRYFTYDSYGNKIAQIDELGAQTSYTYDRYGRLLTTTNALGEKTEIRYGVNETDSYLHTSERPYQIVTPAGIVTQFSYDANGRVLQKIEAYGTRDAKRWNYVYDKMGRVTLRIEQVDQGLDRMLRFEYDLRGRKIREIDSEGKTTSWIYDNVGNVISIVNPDDTFRTMDYDSLGRILRITDEMGHVTNKEWYHDGSIKKIKDANGNIYQFDYNPSGRLINKQYPDDSCERWLYEQDGSLRFYMNRGGQVQVFDYDNMGREISRMWVSNVEAKIATAYDAAGRITQKNNATSSVSYVHDLANRLISESQHIRGLTPRIFSYTNDADGRRIVTSGQDYWVGYRYDFRNNVSEIHSDRWGDVAASYTYKLDSQVESIMYKNNLVQRYDYDIIGRNIQVRLHEGFYSPNLLERLYGYDYCNRCCWVVRDVYRQVGDVFRYQADGQLIEFRQDVQSPSALFPSAGVRAEKFYYDAMGNRTRFEDKSGITYYSADNTNAYTSISDTVIEHSDGRNNITKLKDIYYEYDEDNRPICIRGPMGEMRLFYDAIGRLVQRCVDGVWEYRFYDGSRLALVLGANGVNEKYIHGAHSGGLVSLIKSSVSSGTRRYYFHQDYLGNVLAVTDDSMRIVESYVYDPFGAMQIYNPNGIKVAASQIENRNMFCGQEYWEKYKIYNLNRRIYSPQLGRFMQYDPLGFQAGDKNLYRYCSNDPINFRDISGLMKEQKPEDDPDVIVLSPAVPPESSGTPLPVDTRGPGPYRDRYIFNPGYGPSVEVPSIVEMKLPDNPGDLGPEWTPDTSHQHPNGQRFRDPSGRYIDWHPAQPGRPGWRGKNHWHDNGGEEHLPPGTDIPDPAPAPSGPPAPTPQSGFSNGQKVMVGAGTVGAGYLIYRGVRMIPSLVAPPLRPTIPANIVIP